MKSFYKSIPTDLKIQKKVEWVHFLKTGWWCIKKEFSVPELKKSLVWVLCLHVKITINYEIPQWWSKISWKRRILFCVARERQCAVQLDRSLVLWKSAKTYFCFTKKLAFISVSILDKNCTICFQNYQTFFLSFFWLTLIMQPPQLWS